MEQWMMAEKARLFQDKDAETKIMQPGTTPRQAKSLGRKVKGFDEKMWLAHRVDIVVRGNLFKFNQNSALKDYLLQTGTRILVEASPYDLVWGAGLVAGDPRIDKPKEWPGLNLLGFALMQVRQLIQAQPEAGS